MGKRDDLIAKYAEDIRDKCGMTPDMELLKKVTIGCGPSIYDADPPVCFGGDEVNAPNPSEGVAPGYIDARLNGSDFDPADLPGRGFFGRLQLYISIGQTF